MSTVVQQSAPVGFAGATPLVLTLNGVAAGNSIIVVCGAWGDAAGPTIGADHGAGAYGSIQGRRTVSGSSATAAILWQHNVSAGNKSISVSTDATALFRYGWARAIEVSGLVNAAPNVTMPAASGLNGATSNSPSTGNSSATTAANCFVVAALAVSGGASDAGIDSPATTGYTASLIQNDFNAEMAAAGDYKVVSATGVQSAAWGTLTGSYPWAAALAAFEETSAGTAFELVAEQPIALEGTLGISAGLAFEANIPIEPLAPIALVGTLTISADLQFHTHRWRVPTNAAPGTPVHMIVFSGTSPDYTIHVQGTTTVDASGFADLPKDGGNLGDKAFALVHNFDDDVNTTSIYGGPCIATIVEAGG